MDVVELTSDVEEFTGNVWLLSNSEKVLVDVGTGEAWEEIKQLEELDKVVVTHSHHDHVDNLPKVAKKFDPEIYAENPGNLQVDAEKITRSDSLELAGSVFRVIKTPGHKDDSICLYSKDEGILFTGDLIFPDGKFGRTDLEEGDREKLIKSIEKLTSLDVTRFYPGHENPVEQNADRWIGKSLEAARGRKPKY